MLLNFLDDVLLLDFTLESLQSAFQRFTILDDNFSQPIHLLVWGRRILSHPLVKNQKVSEARLSHPTTAKPRPLLQSKHIPIFRRDKFNWSVDSDVIAFLSLQTPHATRTSIQLNDRQKIRNNVLKFLRGNMHARKTVNLSATTSSFRNRESYLSTTRTYINVR
jgi:hypothetical protein